MPLAISPVPEISISLASPEHSVPEPFSPFTPKTPFISYGDDDFRSTLLSPPIILSPKQLSPLRPLDAPVKGHGLERERFEALLRASRDRNAALGSKRTVDLRKEIAMKAHRSKQVERRALFLSKVQAPPSPTATLIPKTPPESPAIFHYTLPSPGLDSPGEVFDSLGSPDAPVRNSWVEQVDFRMPGDRASQRPLRTAPIMSSVKKQLPSLDQITARLNGRGAAPVHEAPVQPPSARLPAFLQSGRRLPPQTAAPIPAPVVAQPKTRPAFPATVGRLRFPARSAPAAEPEPPKLEVCQPSPIPPPASPTLAPISKLQIITTVVPRTSSRSPTEFTKDNLLALNGITRAYTAQTMLSRLRRRTLSTTAMAEESDAEDEMERKMRRRSAPPELPPRDRSDFSHPVLALPGAF
ncbi:hypothetical protein B0H21DRAFT_384040 [Amylocystis lapponica]|nr:hypothetical protein B0H21DRAFT_384040 [Amylocystis lapponica]